MLHAILPAPHAPTTTDTSLRSPIFDSAEAGYWIYSLQSAGTQLVTVADGLVDWNDFTGRLMYSIRQEGKHQFLRDLSRNVMPDKLEAIQRGE